MRSTRLVAAIVVGQVNLLWQKRPHVIESLGVISSDAATAPLSRSVDRPALPEQGAAPVTRGGFRWQVIVVIALLSIWEGFPFQPLGMAPSFGFQLYTVIVFAGFLLFVARALVRGRVSFTWWEALPLILFIWCTAVSYNWSSVLQSGPLAGWLPGITTVAPLLTIFLLTAIKTTRNDAEFGLYYAAVAASALVIVDSKTELGLLEVYARGSSFTDGHVVFFKVISAFGLVIGVVRSINARSPVSLFLNLGGVAVTCVNVVVLTESRLLSLAVFLALPVIWLLAIRGARKLVTAVLAPLVMLPLLIFFVSTYLANFGSLDQYLAQDTSAKFRTLEYQHFQSVFHQTGGMGFGYMSDSRQYDNVITYAGVWAGYLVGTGKYGMQIVDIGLSSALFQFGYVGLILVLLMTVICIWRLVFAGLWGTDYASTCAVGALMGTLMLSPISTNFFTLSYTANVGVVLWFIASQVGRERRAKQLAQGRVGDVLLEA